MQALREKHRSLDNEITRAEKSPSADHVEIADMKKRKLALKDEIDGSS